MHNNVVNKQPMPFTGCWTVARKSARQVRVNVIQFVDPHSMDPRNQ